MTERDRPLDRELDGVLEDRYGGPSPAVRLVALVLVVAVALSGVGFLTWVVVAEGSPQVQSQLRTWDVVDEHRVVATLAVTRETEHVEAVCSLVAYAEDHTVVGTISLPVLSGPREQTLRVELRTERAATAVEGLGCTAPGQQRAR